MFGHDAALRFLEVFAGTKVKVPDLDVVRKAVQDAEIWVRMEQDPNEAPALAREFDLDEPTVHAVHARMERLVHGVQAATR